MSDHLNTPKEATPSRELLAPLYGEAPSLPPGVANEFEATRDLLRDWMNPSGREEALARVRRSAIGDAVAALGPAARITPIVGQVWVRRHGASEAMPLGDDRELRTGDHVQTPRGSRAMLKFEDGSSLLVREESELVIGSVEVRLSVLAGRFYAWIEKQVEGHFCIRAHGGFATVIGTEFDFSADREGNITIVVSEGQVNYRPSALDSAVISLRRQEIMEHRNGNAAKRTLTAREMSAYTAWTRGDRRRGFASGKVIASLFFAAIAVGVGVYIYANDKRDDAHSSSTPTGHTVATQAGGSTKPSSTAGNNATFNYIELVPGGERSLMTNRMTVDVPNVGEVLQMMATRLERAPGSSVLTFTMEEAKATQPDGSPLGAAGASYAASMEAMKGMVMSFERSDNGEYRDITPAAVPDSGAFMRAMFLVQLNASPQDRPNLKKGDTWKLRRKGKLASGGGYEVDMKFEFEGFEERGGVRMAVIKTTGQTVVTETAMYEIPAPNYTTTIMVDRMTMDAVGRSFIEADTSLYHSVEQQSTVEIELTSRTVVKGRPDPMIQPIPKVIQKQNGIITWEHLQ